MKLTRDCYRQFTGYLKCIKCHLGHSWSKITPNYSTRTCQVRTKLLLFYAQFKLYVDIFSTIFFLLFSIYKSKTNESMLHAYFHFIDFDNGINTAINKKRSRDTDVCTNANADSDGSFFSSSHFSLCPSNCIVFSLSSADLHISNERISAGVFLL